MAVEDIRREHVLAAIAEFDRLGRKDFLGKYGFGPTRKNWLAHKGKFYDAHPILGVAHGLATGEFWTKSRWFYSGGTSISWAAFENLGLYGPSCFLYPIEELRADYSEGRRAPYEYVVFLWALARAYDGKPRLVPFNDVRGDLAELLAPFASAEASPDPATPWASLGQHSELWHLEGGDLLSPTDDDVKRLNTIGGLAERQYSLAQDDRYVNAAVEVIERFIGDEPAFPALLAKLGLPTYGVASSDELAGVVEAVEEIANPRRNFGRRPNAAENRAVEEHAVRVVRQHLEDELGFSTDDVGDTESYDVHATKDGSVIKVEVKGTTTEGLAVMLTANEVALHRGEYPNNALAVVRNILLDRSGDVPVASGGQLEFTMSWVVEDDRLEPIAYRYRTRL